MSDSDHRDVLDEVVTGIYDAATGDESWSAPLEAVVRLVGAQTLTAAMQHPDGVEILYCSLPQSFISEYQSEWCVKDHWTQGALRLPPGTPVIGPDCMPDEDFTRTEFYNELGRPYDIRYVVGGIVKVGPSIANFGWHRPDLGVPFGPEEKNKVSRVLPHLQRALALRARFSALGGLANLGMTALDALPLAIAVVDPALRPVIINRKAEQLLGRADGLKGGLTGRPLSAYRPEDTTRLHTVVADACRRPAGAGGGVSVGRSGSDTPLLVVIAPLIGRPADRLLVSRPMALILILDPDDKTVPRARILHDLFGLTAAEIALAEGLATGDRLEDIANRRGVLISTLRSQLASILQKTGCDRQATLVRLLTSLAL